MNGALLRRGALALFAVYVFLLGAAAIAVSRVEVDFATYVWGAPSLIPGETSGLRVAVLDPSSRRFYDGFEATVSLERDGVRIPLAAGSTDGGALSLTLSTAADLAVGDATLVVETRRGEQADAATKPIRVSTPPRGSVSLGTAVSSSARSEPRIEMLPAGGSLVPELEQLLVIRGTEADGRPMGGVTLATKLLRGRIDGLPASITLDAAGLAQATVRPRFHDLLVRFTLVGRPPIDVRIVGKPTQLVADAGPAVVATSGWTLDVRSLHESAMLYADVWDDTRWLAATSAQLSEGRASIQLPTVASPTGSRPLTVQVYRTFAAPGRARYSAARVLSGPATAAIPPLAAALVQRDIDRAWLDHLRTTGLLTAPPDPELLLRTLLARWPDRPPEPPLLIETATAREKQADDVRAGSRRRILWALSITGILLVLGIATVVVTHMRRLEQRYQTLREDEDFDNLGRSQIAWPALLLLATIAVAIVGMVVLIDSLRWGISLQ